jgi:thiosulfate dehydrogenase
MPGSDNPFEKTASYSVVMCSLLLLAFLVAVLAITVDIFPEEEEAKLSSLNPPPKTPTVWKAPDLHSLPRDNEGEMIRYGHELIEHTALYLGPEGKVANISNGMNCQNCHLEGGTKPFGNNYASVASTYPKFRARSGSIESVEKRINDCLERSLNGSALPDSSLELKAIKAYILWVGRDIDKDTPPAGAGLAELPLMDRAADPAKGKLVFEQYCVRCHGPAGRGRKIEGHAEWTYPPLVGDSSYSIGAGLYRLSRFAAYVKNNMPDGTTYLEPVLSDDEAWDVAAYINSLPRPERDLSKDWPDIATKPFDHPFGPFADSFSDSQHKYGPYGAIRNARGKNN